MAHVGLKDLDAIATTVKPGKNTLHTIMKSVIMNLTDLQIQICFCP